MYSQYDEEKYVLEICASVQHKRLLDIGAWDPVTFSNSRALIEAGWDALLIEPSPGPLKNLITAYAEVPRVHVLGGAVTVEPGFFAMKVTDDAVSGNAGPEWKDAGFYGEMIVLGFTLTQLFERFGGDWEMVSIDVEGASVDLFREMIRIGPRPRCVVLEHDSRFVELAQFAEAAQYRQVHLNGTNVVLEWTGVRE